MGLKSWLFIIPARLSSSRLPNKPLQDLGGKPLIVRVADNLRPLVDEGATVLVATDAEEVQEVCTKYGHKAVLTSANHPSGTDRCFEAAEHASSSIEFIMNVQGDEPFVSLEDLKGLAAHFSSKALPMGTLIYRNRDQQKFLDPSCVKVAVNQLGEALYFSRAPIPHDRDQGGWPGWFWQHVGVYAYRRTSLEKFCALDRSVLETHECLEQLRALDHGWSILTYEAKQAAIGIDTPEDLEKARTKYD
jgi:3-deoxy-manno-octulosonate cytidylyltransferase (CMP-KDO synthetase)